MLCFTHVLSTNQPAMGAVREHFGAIFVGGVCPKQLKRVRALALIGVFGGAVGALILAHVSCTKTSATSPQLVVTIRGKGHYDY